MRESDTKRAESAGPGRSEDGTSGKRRQPSSTKARGDKAVLLRPAPRDQKGSCERGLIETGKPPSKAVGLKFDQLVQANSALAMPHVNF